MTALARLSDTDRYRTRDSYAPCPCGCGKDADALIDAHNGQVVEFTCPVSGERAEPKNA